MRNQKAAAGRSSDDEFWQQLLRQFDDWWEEYGRTLIVVGVIAAAVLVSYNAYRKKLESDEAATWERLARMPDMALLSMMNPQDVGKERQQVIESCQQILDSRWTTNATPWVLLRQGNAYRNAGQLDNAVAAFGRLTGDHPESRAADMAKAPLASTFEEMGQHSEAAELFQELAEKQGKESVYWMDVARNLELAGQIEQAMKYYRQLNNSLDESTDIARAAAYRLKYLKEGTALTTPPPPPPDKETGDDENTNAGQSPPQVDEETSQGEGAEAGNDDTHGPANSENEAPSE